MSKNSDLIKYITSTSPYQDYFTVYRPDRVLYYIENTTEQEIEEFYKGVLPGSLGNYIGQYGTYDSPGLFTLSDKRQVLGIELRADDPNISYPKGLATINLKGGYLLYCDFCYDFVPSMEDAMEIFSASKKWFQDFDRGTINKRDAEFIYVTYSESRRTRLLYPIEDETYKFEITRSYDTMSKAELLTHIIKDPLMEAYNWSYFFEKLANFPQEGIKDYAFAYFDVKRFKMLKEIHNSAIAIKHLNRIAVAMTEHDWIYYGCRCDNDNFAMMIKDMPRDMLDLHLREFFDSLSRLESDPSYRIYYRCGVVDMRTALNTALGVTDYAKIAHKMCDKEVNSTEICYYTDEMWEKDLWGKKIRNYLPTAIKNNEFVIHLQPKFDIESEKIIGAEALVRWNYQKRELLYPDFFIPFFEVDNSISALDDVVLRKVCEHIRDWKIRGLEPVPISVNVSQKEVEQGDLADRLERIVDSYEIEHDLIEFELTERIAYDNQDYLLSVIRDIKSRGFLISMDDFGTGYSSLNLLMDMPLDTLKIDKSFIDHLVSSDPENKNTVIIQHIITMAKDLKVTCLAEGAEDQSQIEALRKLGCDSVQGYYYSKPISVPEFEVLQFMS
ncbi:MAG: EAL domain-containing protein [Lachnospiraceae bacterium]|nr:EAL domain-containing protein [Lachnospiraceae bacterium]